MVPTRLSIELHEISDVKLNPISTLSPLFIGFKVQKYLMKLQLLSNKVSVIISFFIFGHSLSQYSLE